MATTVSTIYDNLKTIVSANVPSGYLELKAPRVLEDNDSRVLTKGWGIRFLDGPTVETITKAYTIDQGFELIFTRTNPRQVDESDIESAEKELFDAATDVLIQVVHGNLNGTAGVSKVSAPDFSEPELLDNKSFIALRVQIIITYRQSLI